MVEAGAGHESPTSAQFVGADHAVGELWQSVFIPQKVEVATLRFWRWAENSQEQPGDVLEVIMQYGDDQADKLLDLPAMDPRFVWRPQELDLRAYAGRRVGLTFFAHTDDAVPSIFRVDDVSLEVCGAYRLYLPRVEK